MLSDALHSYGDGITEEELSILAYGSLTPAHATQFIAYVRQVRLQYSIGNILSGKQHWPTNPQDRDILYFLAQSLRAQLLKELPPKKGQLSGDARELAFRTKDLLLELSAISLEIAQLVVADDDGKALPGWFLMDIAKDLPKLAKSRVDQ